MKSTILLNGHYDSHLASSSRFPSNQTLIQLKLLVAYLILSMQSCVNCIKWTLHGGQQVPIYNDPLNCFTNSRWNLALDINLEVIKKILFWFIMVKYVSALHAAATKLYHMPKHSHQLVPIYYKMKTGQAHIQRCNSICPAFFTKHIHNRMTLASHQFIVTFLKNSPKDPVRFGFFSLFATACNGSDCCCCFGDSCSCCLLGDTCCEVEGCGCFRAPVGCAWMITLPAPGTYEMGM